jgi:hypothetical protein
MLARRLTTILPTMSLAEALETTRIHSVAGLTGARTAVVTTRPCRVPHHTVSDVGGSGAARCNGRATCRWRTTPARLSNGFPSLSAKHWNCSDNPSWPCIYSAQRVKRVSTCEFLSGEEQLRPTSALEPLKRPNPGR